MPVLPQITGKTGMPRLPHCKSQLFSIHFQSNIFTWHKYHTQKAQRTPRMLRYNIVLTEQCFYNDAKTLKLLWTTVSVDLLKASLQSDKICLIALLDPEVGLNKRID